MAIIKTGRGMRPLYRVWQFARAVNPKLSAREYETIKHILTPAQLELFDQMSPGLRRHSFNVLEFLLERGHTDQNLLVGALLHDAGKRGMGLPCRVFTVLLQAFWPNGIERIASPDTTSWRYGLYAHIHHCPLGAKMAQETGASVEVVDLILNHHNDEAVHPHGRLLKMADEAN